jgi:hypothetical protein
MKKLLLLLVLATTALTAQNVQFGNVPKIAVIPATGTITTQNLNPTGVATAGSAVEITLNGAAGIAVQTVGTFTGALTAQVTIDGVNWISVGGTAVNIITTKNMQQNIASNSNSIFQFQTMGATRARITPISAFTGSVAVFINAVANTSSVAIDTQLVTGGNTIGFVNQGSTTAGTAWLANPLNPTVSLIATDAGAKIVSFNGATQTNATAIGVQVVFNVGTVTGTLPTMICKLQGSADSGTTWFDIPSATTPTLIATGVYGIMLHYGVSPVAGVATSGTTAQVSSCLPRTWRVVYTIGGTTPSFTITNVQVNYLL